MRIFYLLLISALPVVELRGALPLALTVYNLSVWQAITITVIGNMIPVPFILWLLPKIIIFFRNNWRFADRAFAKIFAKTRLRHSRKVELYGAFALILIVAIPLPGTGAWTGSLVAYLFGFESRKAFWLIFGGVILAAVAVTLMTVVFSKLF